MVWVGNGELGLLIGIVMGWLYVIDGVVDD